MESMFNGCNQLKTIKGLTKFITANVVSMRGIFADCFRLEELDLSNFDISKVISMDYMLNNCNNI